jgi:ribosomal-protein-alanine N-acetyltransferase
MNLRDYQPADLETISRIEQQCFPSTIAADRESLEKMLSGYASAIVVEAHGGNVVAFVIFRKVNRVTGSLLSLDVLPSHRRQGLGMHLVSAAKQRLAEMGVEKLRLRVAVDNAAALAMYRKIDFRRLRVDRAFYRDGSDAYMLETAPWKCSWHPAAVWTRIRERVRHYRVTGRLRRLPKRNDP